MSELKTFSDFWPYYVAEHSNPFNRILHLIGSLAGLACLVFFIVTGRWYLVPLALVPGYGMAWVGHFLVEKNKPASFKHPLWSFMGDWKMIGLILTGKMNDEIKKSKGLSFSQVAGK